ncbi:hypothetical protein QO016_004869 [Methylobacterium persicinum]|uniref:Uncharacterized protein n=1 Tax=Methylobacterium persicinum TaxID=374426 RepID=A0ABU0HSL4_9HYPH|nr:hypothetical protein [Methylobacterium persicinum]GJE39772.1 hypothetical protein KHHGKMAE_3858 [Methylobacterium persicinum]
MRSTSLRTAALAVLVMTGPARAAAGPGDAPFGLA